MKIYLSPANHHKPYAVSGYTEKNEMEKIAKLVQSELEKYQDVTVYYPTVFASDQSYVGRPQEAKKLGLGSDDLYLAIHSNATANAGEKAIGAIGFYHSSNPKSKKIATALGTELNNICPYKPTQSNNIYDGMLMFNGYGLGEIREPYKLGMTGTLIETNFHSYKPIADWIINNTEKIANAIVKAIVDTYGLKLKNSTTSDDKNTNNQDKSNTTLYRVQAGAYTTLNLAKTLSNKLNLYGYNTIIVKGGNFYKVQVGAFSVKSNADKLLDEIKSLGFIGFITTAVAEIVYNGYSTYKLNDKVNIKSNSLNTITNKILDPSLTGNKVSYTISEISAGKVSFKENKNIKVSILNISKAIESNPNNNASNNSNNTNTAKFPFEGGKFKVTSIYGNRFIFGKNDFHPGIDLVGISSQYITSVTDGTVVRSRIVTDKTNRTWEWVRINNFY